MLALLQRYSVPITTVVLAGAYWLILIAPFFPNDAGMLGHDHRGSLSEMMIGFLHYHQNPLGTIPWLTPATCGGNMFVAGVANPYFNLQQWLIFYVEPLWSIKLTYLIFAMAGFAGTYFLLRRVFEVDKASALVGATIMLFNGFFAYRMIIGHVGFHSFMLAPAIACLLLTQSNGWGRNGWGRNGWGRNGWGRNRWGLNRWGRGALVALMFAYIILSSGVYTLIPTLMVLGAVILTWQLRFDQIQWSPWGLLFSGLGVAFLISAFKISLAFNVAQNFDRSAYTLPGIPDPLLAILVPLRMLFVSAPEWMTETRFLFANYTWKIGQHELEMGVGWVTIPLLLYAAYLLARHPRIKRPIAVLSIAGIAITLLIPIALNYYSPAWNDFLKSVPIVKSFSLFVRFYAVYIPLIAIWAALALYRLPKHRPLVSAVVIACIVATNYYHDKSYYHNQSQPLDPALIKIHHVAWQANPALMPTIGQVTNSTGVNFGDEIVPIKNESFLLGATNMNCQNDMFGYRLEEFPKRELLMAETSVFETTDGRFNLKNPACYVFPDENNCEVGDHFLLSQESELKQFTAYQNYEFAMPGYQRFLNMLSLLSFAGTLLVAAGMPLIQRLGSINKEPLE